MPSRIGSTSIERARSSMKRRIWMVVLAAGSSVVVAVAFAVVTRLV